jgi:long-chain fatty acid transport protein
MPANARGGADVAVGDTALSQIENPATLSFQLRRRPRVDTTAQLGIPISTWKGPVETAESHLRAIPMGSLGVAFATQGPWSFGLAFHSKAGLGTDYRMRHLLIPFMQRNVGSRMKCADLQFNASYRLSEKLAVAGGVRVEGAQSEFSMVLGPADLDFSAGSAYGGGFQVGLLYTPRSDLRFGLAYRSPTWMSDLQGAEAKATLLGVLPVALGDAAILDFKLPQRIAGGVTWDVDRRLKLMGEVRWFNYANSSMHDTTIATGGWLDVRYPLPLGYQNQWAFIAGAEYRLTRNWVAGAGYHYATAPVGSANLLPMGSTISEHHITAGLRYETERWWAGVSYVLGLPTTLRGNGSSSIPLGVDYAFSEIEQTQHIVGVGFGFDW